MAPPPAHRRALARLRVLTAELTDWSRRQRARGAERVATWREESPTAQRIAAWAERSPTLARARRRPVLAGFLAVVGAILAVAVLVPVLGGSDEAIALAGERFFGVEELPDIEQPPERSVLLDAAGQPITVLSGAENRDVVPLDEIPDVVIDAVLATEDAGFFDHEGIEPAAILRAAIANVTAGEVEQGASTITQQYVKNALLTNERSFERKITEATWAVRLEQRLDKDEILERYLNIAYFGNGTYGVAAASEFYFGVPVGELDLPRAALLAGLVQRPEGTNPVADPEAATVRRNVVLARMASVGAVSAEEAEAARVPLDEVVRITEPPDPPHEFFLEYVKKELLDAPELGDTREERAERLFQGGLTIQTTLDVRRQNAAESVLREALTDPATDPLGALVSVHPGTGWVRVMAVGPKTFGECTDDPCTTTKVNPLAAGMGGSGRQPGSAFKPIVLATALSDGGVETDWHTSVRSGQTIEGCGDYAPENYDRSGGVDDLVEAITESNNVFHVKLGQHLGQDRVVAMAERLGIDTELPANCSLPLGAVDVFPLDLAEAYATFANGGVHCEPTAIIEVLDRDGEPVIQREPDCERVLDEEVAETLATLLRRVVERGTATRADIRGDVAAKTGTTNDYRDAWLVGFTEQLATAAWVGFEQPQPMRGILGYRSISGGTLPAQLWADYMTLALEGSEAGEEPSADLERYGLPSCPPPPTTEQGQKDRKKAREEFQKAVKEWRKEAEKAQKEGREPPPAPTFEPEPTGPSVDDPAYDGFDPVRFRLHTGRDGDDFLDGVQPESCVPQGPPEAYAPLVGRT